MKILHFSDTHIGIDTHGAIDPETKLNIRTLDVLDAIDAMIDMAIEENVDLALFAGDAFHRHNPTQTYVNEFGKRMLRLRRHCPVVLLVGNHDMPGGDRVSALEIYYTLEVSDIIVAKDCEIYKVETKSGIAQIVTIPYPNRTWLSSTAISKCNSEEISKLLKVETSIRIHDLAHKVDTTLPTVLLGHFTVEGCQFGSERSLLVSSSEAAVSLEELTLPYWDYVALGHIHKHQDISHGMKGIQPIVYAGSMDRVDFGEEKDPKGFVMLEIVDKHTTWEFIDVDARPFCTLEYSVKGADATDKILSKINSRNLEGAIVRIIINPADTLTKLSIEEDRIRDCILDKGALLIAYFTVRRPEDVAEEQVTKRDIIINNGMSIPDMLAIYLGNVCDSDKELKLLLNLSADIRNTCEVENVKRIKAT